MLITIDLFLALEKKNSIQGSISMYMYISLSFLK